MPVNASPLSLSHKFTGKVDIAPVLEDFLEWLESEKGLTLCEPYKPKYNWYVPVSFNPGVLLSLYLQDRAARVEGRGSEVGKLLEAPK